MADTGEVEVDRVAGRSDTTERGYTGRSHGALASEAHLDQTLAGEGVGNENLTPDMRVGDYLLEEFVARGGFGSVWRARHSETGEGAAVKVLHEELLSSPQVVLRFQREIQAIASLCHPSVVKLYQWDELPDGRPYFAMEFVTGCDLAEYIQTRGTLSPDEALSILEPLSDALELAHERGMIHRDVKASNVMLSEQDGAPRVVLLDFGIAKLLGVAGPQLTTSRCAIGTPSCMAPEQMIGKPVDARVDVYALGALTYQMLTGELPFANAPAIIAEYLHQHGPRPRPSDRANVSSAVDRVIMKAMSKNRDDRYSTVAAFVNAFRRAVGDGGFAQSATATPGQCEVTRVLGFYLVVDADETELDDPDDELLDDLESVIPLAAEQLQEGGFQLDRETGNTALFVRQLSRDPSVELTARRSAIDTVIDAVSALADRPHRDSRVRVSTYLHVSEASTAGDTLDTTPLLEMAEWARKTDRSDTGDGLLGSRDALQDLEMPSELASQAPLLFRVRPG
ncbi:MAG: serine/threonine protein kinase [Proteobacteria bacterium]|nr:serine/threonine protein kinase [Pseudomonadota bacterium]